MKKSILMMTAGIAIIAALLCLTCDSGRSPSDDDTDANSLANKFRNPNGTDNPPDGACTTADSLTTPGCPGYVPLAATYNVTVVSGTGGGNYEAGKTVSITANAAPSGQRFKNWTSTPTTVTFANANSVTTTFTMPSSAVTVTAVYEAIPATTYAVTVTNGTGGGNYAAGATVTITANDAPSGQRFKNWTSTPTTVTFANANNATTTFTMPSSAVTVTAVYEAIPATTYAVTVTNGTGGGNYAAGATVSIMADAAQEGQRFKQWKISPAVTFTSGSAATTMAAFTMPPRAVTATAEYEEIPADDHIITVTVDGNGIANANVQSASEGTTITLTAAANNGSRFVRWDVVSGGITLSSATAPSATFTMPNNAVSVKAVFETIKYAVTVTNGTGGGNYAAGATVNITADAAQEGKRFKNWTTASAGVTFADANSATTAFTMPLNAVTVTANYEPIPAITHEVTFVDHNGTTLKQQTVNHGSAATAPSAPSRSGYTFTGWDKAFNNVTEDLTVNAMYNAITTTTYTLQVGRDPAAGGSVSVTIGSGTAQNNPTEQLSAAANTSITITATPASGYTFNNWTAVSGSLPSGVTATSLSITFAMSANVNIKANFKQETVTPPNVTVTTFTDNRDNKTYKKVTIGTLTWMAENLNFDVPNVESDVCYGKTPSNCGTYGRLYDWSTALAVCPVGWHLPSIGEWTTLTNYVGGESTAGKKLKSKSGWYGGENGTDEYGFSALPGGYGDEYGNFYSAGSNGTWWSDAELVPDFGWDRSIYGEAVGSHNAMSRNLYSVRCVQDGGTIQYIITFNANGGTVSQPSGTTGTGGKLTSLPTPTRDGYTFNGWFPNQRYGDVVNTGTVFSSNTTIYAQWAGVPTPTITEFSDSRDGKFYKKVSIGNQTWMAENLNFRNTSSSDDTVDMCYGNSADSCAKYGRLYEWSTALTACPAGWHLPSEGEWETLTSFVAAGTGEGTVLKSSNGWKVSSKVPNGTDNYGFTALPGGYGSSSGSSGNAGYYGNWWTTREEKYDDSAWYRRMDHDSEVVFRNRCDNTLRYSVRCVAD